MLLVGILAGGNTSETFSPDAQLNRTKAYMVFILAFMAITNLIVRHLCVAIHIANQQHPLALHGLYYLPCGGPYHRLNQAITHHYISGLCIYKSHVLPMHPRATTSTIINVSNVSSI
jgi:hypothetical protein